jgi:tyrosyl-tRNA synthetase
MCQGDEPAPSGGPPGPIWECGAAASGRVSNQRGLRPREGETLALARMDEPLSDAARTAAHLARNAVDCLPRGALAERLEEARPLRVKLGLDPTAPDLHLGHTVVLTKLREFQDAGHVVVLIVGDYTARVGDPSGRSVTRPVLSGEEIDENAETYRRQAAKVLRMDGEHFELRHNSEWLDMRAEDMFRLARHPTVAQLLARDDFAKRFKADEPISLLELLYPVLQGYDSVAVRADVELGGTDQTFNLLMGRQIQQAYGQPPQSVLTLPLLTGIDGEQKMSKSFGNAIGVDEPPAEMYGKTLRIPDELLGQWYSLLLGTDPPAGVGPRDAKHALARALVTRFHSAADAEEAERHFKRVIIEHEPPEEIEEVTVQSRNGTVHLPAVIADAFGRSRSEARRMLEQGGVKLDGKPVAGDVLDMAPADLDGRVLQLGKRHFRRLRIV